MRIAPLTERSDFFAAERLQERVWGCIPMEVVPAHLLLAQAHHGGCLLGAWDEAQLVGLVFGWATGPASDYLYSHLAAVIPEQQGRGLGMQLKLAQANWARERGYRRIVWTFDPLQASNARLNLNKLGAVASRYRVDYYGDLDDELNRGVATDRFEVDWWLEVPEVEPDEHLVRFPWPLPAEQRAHWRARTRDQFLEAFAEGLSAVRLDLGPGEARYHFARVRAKPGG